MPRVSEADIQKFQEKVISALKTEYDQGLISVTINNADIDALIRKYDFERIPYWLRTDKVGRGQYDISKYLGVTKKSKAQVSTPAPVQTPTVVAAVAQVIPMTKVQSAESSLDIKSMIPAKDPNYVKFGNHKDLKAIVESGMFCPTFVYGPTGNGKTFTIEQVHAECKKPLIRINMNRMVDEDQLIGSKTLEDGNVKIVEGPVLIAMRNGLTLLIDEIDAAEANAIMCLQSILEGMKNGKPYYFKLKNEVIVPKAGFNIVATANTKGQGSDDGRYIGTNVLNEAFLERFVGTFKQEYPPEKVERDIIKTLMEDFGCYDDAIATSLVKWCTAIRITYADGGCNEVVTTRRMGHIIKAYSIFKDIKKSIVFCTNRFDEATSAAFVNLFEKIHGGEEIPATVVPSEQVPESL